MMVVYPVGLTRYMGVDGVTAATVNLQTQEARVEGTAPAEAICRAVSEVGFTCEEVAVN